MQNPNMYSMSVEPATEKEISTVINNLKLGSSGWDSISAKIVKWSQSAILSVITHVVNTSLSTGVFPNELKLARVVPLLKTGDPMVLSNYRPVSANCIF